MGLSEIRGIQEREGRKPNDSGSRGGKLRRGENLVKYYVALRGL